MLETDASGTRRIYLNTAAGGLTVDAAGTASGDFQLRSNPMPGAVSDGERVTSELHHRVRSKAAAFLNGRGPREISFHFSATAALFSLAFALRRKISDRDNIIVTDLDHMANVSPWETAAAELYRCPARRVRTTGDGRLNTDHLFSLADERTALLAVTLASNGTGSLVPLQGLVRELRRRSPECLVVVDAVHAAPHVPIDVGEMDCDFLVFSGYKLFGPMLGVLWGKENLLAGLTPYRVETNKDLAPFKFEAGMLNNASLAALEAAFDYLTWLTSQLGTTGAAPSDAARFRPALEAVREHEQTLSRRVLEGLAPLLDSGLVLHGLVSPERVSERVPTFLFEVNGLDATATKRSLWARHRIQVADGNHYSAYVYRHLNRPEGVARASFGHYDDAAAADAFVEAVGELVRESKGHPGRRKE